MEQKSGSCYSSTVLHANVTYCTNFCVADGSTFALLGELVRKVSVDNGKALELEDWSVEGICRSCPMSTMLHADVTYDKSSSTEKRLSEENWGLAMTRRRLVCRTSITKKVGS